MVRQISSDALSFRWKTFLAFSLENFPAKSKTMTALREFALNTRQDSEAETNARHLDFKVTVIVVPLQENLKKEVVVTSTGYAQTGQDEIIFRRQPLLGPHMVITGRDYIGMNIQAQEDGNTILTVAYNDSGRMG